MNDYISRKVACNLSFSHGLNEDGILYVPYHEVINYLQNISPANVRLVKSGKWITRNSVYLQSGEIMATCSLCNNKLRILGNLSDFNFCPNCGADMRGGVDG